MAAKGVSVIPLAWLVPAFAAALPGAVVEERALTCPARSISQAR